LQSVLRPSVEPTQNCGYAFIAEHRSSHPVRVLCKILNVHPSGFYEWIKEPLSRRAPEDDCQSELIKDAWKDSGKVYGYRKIHDDLIKMGETALSEPRR
jgi:putative transposase